MTSAEPRRGDVWLADLDKRRPVVVLTRDPIASRLETVIAAPLTTRVRHLKTEVAMGASAGLRRPSVANLDNVRQVETFRLVQRIGRADAATVSALCSALAIAVDCAD